ENINDVKNNWFNIETSPLWKKVENNNIEIFKWYFIKISYQYSTENNFMKFYKVIKIYLNNVFNEFELLNVDSMTYSEQIQNKRILNTGTIYYNNKKKEFSGGGNSYPERGKINLIGGIEEIYQYQGIDTPTEFIAEEDTERDYYTKQETNNLLDKKQDKLIAGENIKIDEKTNTISATGGSSVDENRIFNNKDDKDSTTRLVNEIIKTNVGGKTLIYRNEPVITDDLDIPNKKYMDDAIKYAFQLNAIGTEISGLETKNKTIVGGINENKEKIDKKQDKLIYVQENKWGAFEYINLGSIPFTADNDIPPVKFVKKLIDDKIKDLKIGKWKEVGTVSSDKTNITYNFIRDKRYKVYYNWGQSSSPNVIKEFIFDASNNNYLESFIEENNIISILWLQDNKIFIKQKSRINYGFVSKLEEYQEENTYQINSKTLDIIAPEKIDIEKPLKINSYSLETNEIRENEWDIELKNNPTPSIPQWKEVGTREKNKWDNWQITYDFQENKHYRVYYSWSIYNPVYTIQEFIITD
ncbi:MAG: hypothetical protein H9Q65_05770, partial [Spiroplasma ixodetis]|nr:hypothetical protein [Spiroplasma ixodetis]